MRRALQRPEVEIKDRDGKVVIFGNKPARFLLEDYALHRTRIDGLDVHHGVDLRGLRLPSGIVLSNWEIGGCNIEKAQLQGVVFEDCDMAQMWAPGATFYGARFTRCNLFAVNFERANLRKVLIENSDLISATFEGALFHDTRFIDVSVSDDLRRPGLEVRS